MVAPFLAALTFKLANSCFKQLVDCSCLAFLAAAALKLSRSASNLLSICSMLLLLPLCPGHNGYPVFVKTQRGLFEEKISTLFGPKLAAAKISSVNTLRVRKKNKIPLGRLPGNLRN